MDSGDLGPVSAGSGDAELIGGRAIILDRNEPESGQGTGRLPQKLPATSPIEVVQWTDDASIPGFDRSASVLSDRRVRLLPTPGHTRGHISQDWSIQAGLLRSARSA